MRKGRKCDALALQIKFLENEWGHHLVRVCSSLLPLYVIRLRATYSNGKFAQHPLDKQFETFYICRPQSSFRKQERYHETQDFPSVLCHSAGCCFDAFSSGYPLPSRQAANPYPHLSGDEGGLGRRI